MDDADLGGDSRSSMNIDSRHVMTSVATHKRIDQIRPVPGRCDSLCEWTGVSDEAGYMSHLNQLVRW